MSYRCIVAFFAVTVLVTGTFQAAAAAEPDSNSPTKAPASAPPSTAAPTTAKATPHGAHGAKTAAKAPAAPPRKVDINNASLEELKTGLQLGDTEAKKIIAHRPYKSKGELMTKAGLPEGVYQAVSRKVELQKPRKAVATK